MDSYLFERILWIDYMCVYIHMYLSINRRYYSGGMHRYGTYVFLHAISLCTLVCLYHSIPCAGT